MTDAAASIKHDQGQFDPAWYVSAYPDVAALGIDPLEHYERYGRLLGRSPLPSERVLKRVVLVVPDLSTIGGISTRTRRVLANARDREVEYLAITMESQAGETVQGEICYSLDPEHFLRSMDMWRTSDTAMVISNNAILRFPSEIRSRLLQFPILFIYAGQLAFMLQDSTLLKRRDYVATMRAMKLISFSDGDIAFQRQLGIYGQVKSFVPVEQREDNTFDERVNTRLGYIGRIDFHTKDSARLLEIAQQLRGSPWGPIQLFTTDGRNSPQYQEFRSMICDANLEDRFEFILNETDKESMFRELAFLLVPSRKESFGNSVVEALSFGVPVIAASYAPGPAEILEHGRSGFLLDDYSGQNVADALSSVQVEDLLTMSKHAFERHKRYRVEDHIDQLEQLAREAVADFTGENLFPVYPRLKILDEQ